MVNSQDLKRLIKKKRQAYKLNLEGLPLLKNKETSHILLPALRGRVRQIVSTRCCRKSESGPTELSLLI